MKGRETMQAITARKATEAIDAKVLHDDPGEFTVVLVYFGDGHAEYEVTLHEEAYGPEAAFHLLPAGAAFIAVTDGVLRFAA
jgi:hypothetical protein